MIRRHFLKAAVGSCTLISGCSSPFSSQRSVKVTLVNRREQSLSVTVKVFSEDASTYSDALVSTQEYLLEAQGLEPSTISRENVFKSKKSIIEVNTSTDESDHYHYYPGCSGSNSSVSEEVVIEINEKPEDIEFSQNSC